MDRRKKFHITELSDYDRKILEKYTKFYSNFIESNTAKTGMLEDSAFEGRNK